MSETTPVPSLRQNSRSRRLWFGILAATLFSVGALLLVWRSRQPLQIEAQPFSLSEEVHDTAYTGRYEYSGNCTLLCPGLKGRPAFVRAKLQVRWPDGVSEEEYRTCHISGGKGVLEWSIYPYRNTRGQPSLQVLGADVYPGVTARVLQR